MVASAASSLRTRPARLCPTLSPIPRRVHCRRLLPRSSRIGMGATTLFPATITRTPSITTHTATTKRVFGAVPDPPLAAALARLMARQHCIPFRVCQMPRHRGRIRDRTRSATALERVMASPAASQVQIVSIRRCLRAPRTRPLPASVLTPVAARKALVSA